MRNRERGSIRDHLTEIIPNKEVSSSTLRATKYTEYNSGADLNDMSNFYKQQMDAAELKQCSTMMSQKQCGCEYRLPVPTTKFD